MYIEEGYARKGKRKVKIYSVWYTSQETESPISKKLASFDSLEEAAIVIRFLSGGSLTDEQMEVYLNAMKKLSADTDQSTDTQ